MVVHEEIKKKCMVYDYNTTKMAGLYTSKIVCTLRHYHKIITGLGTDPVIKIIKNKKK